MKSVVRSISPTKIATFGALLLILAASPSEVKAAAQTWVEGGPSDIWSTSAFNWSGGVAWTNGNTAVFSATGEAIELNGAISATAVSGNPAIFFGTSATGYTIADSDNDSTLTLAGATVVSGSNALGTNTISENITLSGGATKTFTQITGGSLAISGNISEDTAGTVVAIGNNSASGLNSVTFSGSNSYTGNTNLTARASLNINGTHAIGSGTLAVTSSAGTAINNTSGGAITLANNNSILLSTGNLTFGGSNDLSFGSGVLTISGNNRTITTNGTATLTLGGIDTDTTTRVLTKSGAGTLAITGAAGSNFQGGSILSSGTVILGNKASLGSGNIAINGAGMAASANLSGANAISNNVTIGTGGASFAGTNNLELSGAVAIGTSKTITNTISTSGGTKLTLSNASISIGDGTTTNATLTIAGSGNTLISGNLVNNTTGVATSRLTVNSSGTVTLGGVNSYTGITTVTAGTLLVNGSIGTGAVSVAAAGSLGGTGTIGGVVSVTGVLTPGSSPGTLTTAGLNMLTGSNYVFEGGDLVSVTGQLDLDSDWNLTLGSGFTNGGSVVLFTFGTLAGSPDLSPIINAAGLGFIPSGPLTVAIDGNSIVLNGISVIPEPSVALLVGMAGTTLLIFRRRTGKA